MQQHNGANKGNSSPKDNTNNTHFQTQLKQTFDGFFAEPQSMKELSIKTGIDRAGICWFCREMRLTNRIAVFKKSYCSITKRLVNKYTTNPDLFPDHSPQLKLNF